MIRTLIDPESATPLGVAFRPVPVDTRRLKVFRITPEMVVGLFEASGPFRVELGGLPADARPVSISYDPSRHTFALVLHSESYEPVADGQLIPDAGNVQIRRVEILDF